jgi:hypothetical protein
MRRFLYAPALACVWAAALPAQDTNELLNRMKAMEDRIKSLEAEVQTLRTQQTGAAVAPVVSAVAPAALPVPAQAAPQEPVRLGGAGAAAAKALNPDISVIGDFVGAIGYPGNRPTPSLEMHESEVGFQEVIDPYARADFFLTFGERGVDLEEGYLTFTSLPAGLQVKVGKMRAAFGKVNTLHNHVLPWVDRPLMTQNLVGGEDGIDDAGLSLSRILPAPKGLFLEGTAQLYRGDTDNIFLARSRSQVATVEHLRAYHDISDSTNIDLGVSYARGHSPFAFDGINQLLGIDATVRWKPLRRSIYRSFVGHFESVWARTQVSPALVLPDLIALPGPPVPGLVANQTVKPFGFYVSGDYQFGRRWFLGGRYDNSQRGLCLPTNPPTTTFCGLPLNANPVNVATQLVRDLGGSIALTYWPSEFSQVRAQVRRSQYGGGITANEILFQFIFSMGAHGAHPF